LIKDGLGAAVVDVHEKSATRIYIEIKPECVVRAATLVFKEMGARLQTATGIDVGDAFEVNYHFAFDAFFCVATIRTRISRENPEIDSIAGICKGAEWIEREMWELLGIRFRNHPDLRHLLLADDWPEGRHPLRRDYRGKAKAQG
jgi:NADH:ubiquinone oxidoreductase subunit C